jgi:DNA-directed RNA polymerase specialized sigma24 family protein
MKQVINDDQSWRLWASWHFTGHDTDLGSIINQDIVQINPHAEHGIYNAWGFQHDKAALGPDWPIPPSLTYEIDEYQQVSVWYARQAILAKSVSTKAINTFRMMESCLAWHTAGVLLEEILNPTHVETTFDNRIDEMGGLKARLKSANLWHHTLHEAFSERGGMSTSALKSKTASVNFAKAREVARAKVMAETDQKASEILSALDRGESHEEIAQAHGIPLGAVPMAISRARKRLGVPTPRVETSQPVQAQPQPVQGQPESVPATEEQINAVLNGLQSKSAPAKLTPQQIVNISMMNEPAEHIARRLGIPQDQIKSTLQQARQALYGKR